MDFLLALKVYWIVCLIWSCIGLSAYFEIALDCLLTLNLHWIVFTFSKSEFDHTHTSTSIAIGANLIIVIFVSLFSSCLKTKQHLNNLIIIINTPALSKWSSGQLKGLNAANQQIKTTIRSNPTWNKTSPKFHHCSFCTPC